MKLPIYSKTSIDPNDDKPLLNGSLAVTASCFADGTLEYGRDRPKVTYTRKPVDFTDMVRIADSKTGTRLQKVGRLKTAAEVAAESEAATPEILSALRSTMHVRRKGGKDGWERLDSFLQRVNMTLDQARSWSRQKISDYCREVEKLEKEHQTA